MTVAANLSMLRAAMNSAEAQWPTTVADAMRAREEIAAATANIINPTPDDVAFAVAEALAAGRDPLDDDTVRRLTTARVLAGPTGDALRGGVDRAAETRVVKALTAEADEILSLLGNAFNAAGGVLSAAWRILGELDLTDSQAVLKMGPDSSRAWTDALDAQRRIRAIDDGWYALAELTRFASSTDAPTSRMADVSFEQYQQLGRKADPWAIVRSGITLDLADRFTIRDRVARLQEEREALRTKPERDFLNEYRRSHGVPA